MMRATISVLSLFVIVLYWCPGSWGGTSESGGPPATADSGDVEQPETLRDWYLKHYDFFSIKDTVFTFETEFEMPDGYRRPDSADLTPFQNWVSHFPLWHRWKPVGNWRGGKAFEHHGRCTFPGKGIASRITPSL